MPASLKQPLIGHFRVALCLCFKTSPDTQPFKWKWVGFAWKWTNDFKIIFIWKDLHQASFWNRGKRQLGNGQFLGILPQSNKAMGVGVLVGVGNELRCWESTWLYSLLLLIVNWHSHLWFGKTVQVYPVKGQNCWKKKIYIKKVK